MSLLIKALESAEKGKRAELQRGRVKAPLAAELILEPLPATGEAIQGEGTASNSVAKELSLQADSSHIAAVASAAKVRQQSESKSDHDQKLAANIFVANQSARNPTSASVLLILGIAGALAIWLGLQGYRYLGKLNAPDAIIVKPAPQIIEAAAPEAPVEPFAQSIGPQTQDAAQTQAVTIAGMTANDAVSAPSPEVNKHASVTETAAFISNDTIGAKSVANKKQEAKNIADNGAKEYGVVADEGSIGSKKVPPLKLVSRTPAAGVDPTLLAAYQAYRRGDHAAAQQQYRQVLQSDVRSVDALLGMAAIAARQSRYMDANGWYQKVLEIEPRNTIALSAIANSQISTESAGAGAVDYADTESRIKSMLAQQPEAANLHATLGNLYAAQNQWSLAQAAYFNASRYAPNSADYAFNLAVSLDQLGKSGLALVQYRRALDLLNSAGTSSFDKTQLEARIQALQ